MGVRLKLFQTVDEADTFLESRDDISYLDIKVRSLDQNLILVFEEDDQEDETQVKGFKA